MAYVPIKTAETSPQSITQAVVPGSCGLVDTVSRGSLWPSVLKTRRLFLWGKNRERSTSPCFRQCREINSLASCLSRVQAGPQQQVHWGCPSQWLAYHTPGGVLGCCAYYLLGDLVGSLLGFGSLLPVIVSLNILNVIFSRSLTSLRATLFI